MLDWAGEVPANPGVTGNQNSNAPTCAHSVIWDVRSSVKWRLRSLRRLRPLEAINRSCPVCFVATDIALECTARKCKDDNTAIRPMRGAAAVEIYWSGKRQKTAKVECFQQKITLAGNGSRAKGMG